MTTCGNLLLLSSSHSTSTEPLSPRPCAAPPFDQGLALSHPTLFPLITRWAPLPLLPFAPSPEGPFFFQRAPFPVPASAQGLREPCCSQERRGSARGSPKNGAQRCNPVLPCAPGFGGKWGMGEGREGESGRRKRTGWGSGCEGMRVGPGRMEPPALGPTPGLSRHQ